MKEEACGGVCCWVVPDEMAPRSASQLFLVVAIGKSLPGMIVIEIQIRTKKLGAASFLKGIGKERYLFPTEGLILREPKPIYKISLDELLVRRDTL